MNFNVNIKQSEYDLKGRLIDESINLYGVAIDIIKVIKQNQDSTFGDFSHLKSGDVHKIYALPENSDNWDNINTQFTQFGMVNMESVSMFVSAIAIKNVFPGILDVENNTLKGFGGILGSLVVLPSSRIMEISDVVWEVPGVNNVYTSKYQKSALKLTLKTYDNKAANEMTPINTTTGENLTPNFESLENYFLELVQDSTAVDTAANVNPVTPIIGNVKPLVDNTEDAVFGRF